MSCKVILPFVPLRRDMASNNRVSTPNLEIILDGFVNLDTGKTPGWSWEIKPGD
jgi:hypothetical protein